VLGEGLHKILDIRTVLAHATYVSKNDAEKKVQSQLFEGTKITPWSIGLQQLKVHQAVTQFSVSDGTRRFLTTFT